MPKYEEIANILRDRVGKWSLPSRLHVAYSV